jgi:hypothetical protein
MQPGGFLPPGPPGRAQACEKSRRRALERGLLLLSVMDIAQMALMVGPLLGATAGYLIDGITGATSGFVIPMGPLVVAWLLGDR